MGIWQVWNTNASLMSCRMRILTLTLTALGQSDMKFDLANSELNSDERSRLLDFLFIEK